MAWERPELVHSLACTDNHQTVKQEFERPPFGRLYRQYRDCSGDTRILHGHNLP